MNGTKKTSEKISHAVAEFMKEEGVSLDKVSVALLGEKVFSDKYEYTVELFKRNGAGRTAQEPPVDEINFAVDTLDDLLNLSGIDNYSFEKNITPDCAVIKIHAPNKEGLLIGKNGQNISALQYLISIILEKKYKCRFPVILDIDTYRQKHRQRLAGIAAEFSAKALASAGEWLTELMPSFDRKIIHEECALSSVKTFSIGRGAYKKVVVTSLL